MDPAGAMSPADAAGMQPGVAHGRAAGPFLFDALCRSRAFPPGVGAGETGTMPTPRMPRRE
jgi:hypothetical protein